MTPIQETIINKKTTTSPIWLMRQAGRYLPEFREIRKLNPDFINLCLNENLSSEITLQPLKRFDLDAAIIFSDILMLPHGLNQKVEFKKDLTSYSMFLNWALIAKNTLSKVSPVESEIRYIWYVLLMNKMLIIEYYFYHFLKKSSFLFFVVKPYFYKH